MRYVSVLLAPAVLWLTALSPAIAQDAKPVTPLSLKECLDIALYNQVDVQVAKNNLDASKSRSTQARADYLPQLSVENNTFNIGSNGVLTERNTGTAITATQNIFDGGLREARVAGARYGVTQSMAGLERTVQLVAFDVTRSYYEVLRAKHLSDVADADVKYNEALKEVVQSRVEVGDAAEVDVLPVEAQLANARVALISAQNSVRTAMIQLQNGIGLSPQRGFDIVDVSEPPNPELRPIDVYVSEAIASRPDVLQVQAGVGAAKASVKSSKIALYPRPRIVGQYEKGVGGLHGESSQIIGGITFDIFNGGANRAAHKETLANQATAEQRSRQLVKDIQAQVEEAYLNLNDAKERLAASQVGFDAAQRNYEVQQARYKQGLAIPLDLLNAELQVVTAQTNVVQARYDLYTAIAQMDLAVGKDGGFNASQK